MFKNAADFPVLAFGQCHFNPLIASGAAFQIRVDLAVADAFDLDAFDQILKLGLADFSVSARAIGALDASGGRSEEHTSELQSLMRISYAVFCLKNKRNK